VEERVFTWQTTDNLRIFAREWVGSDAPRGIVCLVHGLGEHSGRYQPLAQALTANGYNVLTYDQRGHGQSAGRRGDTPTYEALLADIDRLLEEAEKRYSGLPVFLYGHSLGGNLVLNYILRRRPALSGAVVTSPWLKLAFEPPAWQILLARIMNRIWPRFTQKNGLDPEDLSHDAACVAAYSPDGLVHDRISARLYWLVHEAGRWALDNAAEFHLPLLLMHGTGDRITSVAASREFAAQLSDQVTFKAWEGLRHELHNEQERTEVIEYILSWLGAKS